MRANVAALTAILAISSQPCIAETVRTEFERGFIGREWNQKLALEGSYPLSERCRYAGYSLLAKHDEFSVESFVCDERKLELLVRATGNQKVLVLDAVLFPKLAKGERIMMTGDCEIQKKADKFFFVLVNLGKRESVNWKTGVKAAWYPNPETGKIEELPTRHIVCYRPTPP